MRLYQCAVCGKDEYIGFTLCKNCWSEWTVTGTQPQPEWLKMLIANEFSFQTNYAAIKETVFSDIEDGEDEHKIEKILVLSQLNLV